ncbi:MAG: hypothetical protein ABSG32_16220 [Terriglobia bacterium]|jgi:hypothetical protein
MKTRLSWWLSLLPCLIVVVTFLIARRIGNEQAKTLLSFVGLFIASLSMIPAVHQFIENRKVKYLFGANDKNKRAFVWVTNLGVPVFTVTKVLLRTMDSEQAMSTRHPVKQGDQCEIDITEILLRVVKESLWDDIEIGFAFSSPHESGTSTFQPCHVMAPYGSVDRISCGFEMPSDIRCPKCGQTAFVRVEDLQSFRELAKRQERTRRDLMRSCPQHKSKWLATIRATPSTQHISGQ